MINPFRKQVLFDATERPQAIAMNERGEFSRIVSVDSDNPQTILDREIDKLTGSHEYHEAQAKKWREIEADARERAKNHEAAASALSQTLNTLNPNTFGDFEFNLSEEIEDV